MLSVQRCQKLFEMCDNDPDFLDLLIADDESWIFEDDPETKR